MSENTKIEWADHSWSPWRGCAKVSPGCANCYAETLSKRNPAVLGEWGKGKPRVLAKNWGDPMRWQKRTAMNMPRPRVFPSLCDWLDDEVSPAWLADFLALINLTPHLDWLLLTKRPENWMDRIDTAALASTEFHQKWLVEWLKGTPPPNVWFGVSVEDQTRADERIPMILDIPAQLRWLSVEPLIGPVKLETIENALTWYDGPQGIQWLVIGGESGHGARPCNIEWIRRLVGEGMDAGIPVFVKQLGKWAIDPSSPNGSIPLAPCHTLNLKHPKGGDPSEWPDDLRVRQFPGGEK